LVFVVSFVGNIVSKAHENKKQNERNNSC